MSDHKGFKYSYASPRRNAPPVDDEAIQPRQPHSRRAVIYAVLWGVASCLVFGAGLSCILTTLGGMAPGFVLGLMGIGGMAAGPAVYRWLMKRMQP